jgi:protein involved in polysaccharide export with SLBB domain
LERARAGARIEAKLDYIGATYVLAGRTLQRHKTLTRSAESLLKMIPRKILCVLFLLSTACWAQSPMRVPTGGTPQCDRPDSADCQPDEMDQNSAGTLEQQRPDTGMQEEPDADQQGYDVYRQGSDIRQQSPTYRVPPVTGETPQQMSSDQLRRAEQLRRSTGKAQVPRPNWQQENQTNRTDTVPEKPSEYQKFVFASTGQHLPIYGQSLFRRVPSTFAPVNYMPVPADYVIGPGDELQVRIWGQIDLDASITVDRNGQIYLPKVGTLTVAGVKYEQLSEFLRTNVGRLFKNFDLSVNIGRLRSIQVFVVGHAKRPGAYTIGSLSTLVNALFASGGPDATGSMRRILLKRQDQVVSEFDLYDLIVKGDKSKDVLLRAEDVIFIPPLGPQVAILGSVNSPAIYELRGQERLGALMETAGGLSTTADSNRAILERIENGGARKVEEFALDDDGYQREVQNGDVVRVFPVSPRFENAITLRGNVAHPGRYAWRPGMRIRDLIPSREAIVTRDYWARQNQLGQNSTEWIDRAIERQKQEKQELDARKTSQLETVVRTKEEQTTVKRNPAEINWDYAVIQRLNPEDLTSRLLPFNLGRAIGDASSPDNLALESGDVITIFSQTDLKVPVAERTKFVRIEGEVKAAGFYRVEPGETLRDLVNRAGGLTEKAYLFASDFRRESTRLDQQKRLEEAAKQIDHDLRAKESQAAAMANPEDRTAALQQVEQQRQTLQQFRTLKATGRIVLDLKPTDSSVSDLPRLDMEDGDTLNIPSVGATIQIVGSVYNENAFLYQPKTTLRRYLAKAGGATRDADRDRTFVIRADGSVVSKQMHRSLWSGSFDNLVLMSGDTVVVPARIKTTSILRELRDWSQVFAQFALGAAAVRVINQ